MRKPSTIKHILGLSQDEMAMLLGITPSQWSMFKSDKRDIPLAAKEQLAFLLQSIQKKEVLSEEGQQLRNAERDKTKEKLRQELQKVKIKSTRLEKQISVLENLRTESLAALEVSVVLAVQKANQRTVVLAESIRLRALNNLKKHSLFKLADMQIKKESFELLRSKIEEKIKQMEQ
ncbi:MAG TPA: hypothetical protein VLB74_08060 [Flavobacterium sp.]|uniref:hypothetical protein n=1 Tax=Flavobacterium sp. TaxID=239 RepID=UPI002CB3F7A2|nr:hypothetical protein [Flavobacterium sp.]HSD14588.1 hypothetical protein [Flavobacterium sp.]